MTTVDRIKKLCAERKIPISRMEKDLNFSNGYISQLRKGVVPSDRLKQVADYFNVTMDYLESGNTESPKSDMLELVSALEILRDSPDTRALLEACKTMTPKQIEQITDFARFLRENS